MNLDEGQSEYRPGAKPSARITLAYAFGRLDSAVPEVEEAFEYHYREFVPGGRAGYAIATRTLVQSMQDLRGRMVFSAGLVPRIVELLEARGYSVSICDQRTQRPQQIPEADVLAASSGHDRIFLEAIAVNPLGQIEVSGFKAVVRRISQIAYLFPRAKIVVVAGTYRRARALRRALGSALHEIIGRAGHRTVQLDHRIVVASPTYLHALDSRDVHAVIIPDVADLGDHGAECIGGITFDSARTYLFRKPGQNLGARAEMRCEAVAGRLIFRLSPERAAVRVQICRVGSFPLKVHSEALERKRLAIWHNDSRNDLIARIGDAFGRKDQNALWSMGLILGDTDSSWLDELPELHVNILVESIEHAHELHRRLPTWRVRTSAGYDRRCPQSQSGTIVTLTAADVHGIHPEVLIRADGGCFPLNVRGVPPWKKMMPAGRMYLVDVDDDIDSQSRRDLLLRLSHYRNLGWEVTEPFPPRVALPEAKKEHSNGGAAEGSHGNNRGGKASRHRVRKQAKDLNRRPRADIEAAITAGDPPSGPSRTDTYRTGHPTAGIRGLGSDGPHPRIARSRQKRGATNPNTNGQ